MLHYEDLLNTIIYPRRLIAGIAHLFNVYETTPNYSDEEGTMNVAEQLTAVSYSYDKLLFILSTSFYPAYSWCCAKSCVECFLQLRSSGFCAQLCLRCLVEEFLIPTNSNIHLCSLYFLGG